MARNGCAVAYNNTVNRTTENKEDILIMLYEGALKAVRLAGQGIEEKSPKKRGENISRVLRVLIELDCALDREAGGEMAQNLSDLYRYMMDRLTVANLENDRGPLEETEKLLKELKTGFDQALLQTKQTEPVQTKQVDKSPEGGLRVAV